MKKTLIAAALFAAIGTAHADPVTLTYTDTFGNEQVGTLPNNSSWSGNPWNQGKPVQGNVYAGEFKFKTSEGLDFYAFCADIFHTLKSGTTYQMDALTTGSVAGIGSWEIARIGYLFDNYGDYLDNSANGKELTAFQLTLWEILFENGKNQGNQNGNPLSKGNFKVGGFGDADDLANGWIKDIYDNTQDGTKSEKYDLFFLTSSSTCTEKYTSGNKKGQCKNGKMTQDSQNLISWTAKPEDPQDPAENPNEIPEPMPLVLLTAGLLALGFTRKLRCC
ncbi:MULTISPECIES: hypothetical protein [Nitrosomonas]|uniref:Secreted protein with PEP-CTERM sorting signal n=2 Tax=Nitrosomonas eutropha TaxID=916 RepID=A0ABX5M6I0_9PROT|nr:MULTISPECIES: hypothetical protein [Nitrosomonas]ABI59638.1 PEP motif putative anchor-like protein [Nitrosomonas eutropha C91]MXS80593.1 hypothetical protein [Nitrosomonas sp. GH22]PXV80633.1 putative secreted protein with PEP-CTERM sorting signal [Nitrosomonas eutropha]SCX01303.1 PEP-CTERM protein-sorting domain-containing protein [Nitrosomonas eutropha]SDW79997.1 PEP-CTERM protein-sorting domain-containing protein [Nitrosomonas eutropha]